MAKSLYTQFRKAIQADEIRWYQNRGMIANKSYAWTVETHRKYYRSFAAKFLCERRHSRCIKNLTKRQRDILLSRLATPPDICVAPDKEFAPDGVLTAGGHYAAVKMGIIEIRKRFGVSKPEVFMARVLANIRFWDGKTIS